MDIKNISSTFTAKSDEKLSEIMKKYNLEESIEKIISNVKEGRTDNVLILTWATMAFFRAEITKEKMAETIQKETDISLQTANQITAEIIADIIPTIGKPEKEVKREVNKIEKTYTVQGLKAPIEVEKILNQEVKPRPEIKQKIEPPIPKARVAKPVPTQAKPTVTKPTGPDTYREPIE